MRRKLMLGAVALGVAGALLPASPAAAVCFQLPTGQCVSLCPANAWNGLADAVNRRLGDDSPVGLAHMYCLA